MKLVIAFNFDSYKQIVHILLLVEFLLAACFCRSSDISNFLSLEIAHKGMLRLDWFSDHPLPTTVDGCTGFIVLGTHAGCGKSSFAFQAAMTATAAGLSALVLCSESVLYRKLPHPKTALDSAPPEQLARIHFSYVTSLSNVRRVVSSLGSERSAVIIVEDDGLDDAADPSTWLKTLGVLDATIRWLRSCGPPVADARFVFVTNNFDTNGGRYTLPFCPHAALISLTSSLSGTLRAPWNPPIQFSL